MRDGKRIALFAGTTEGRRIAEHVQSMNVRADVYAATGYGASLLPVADNLTIHAGRMSEEAIREMLMDNRPALCVDATHPYAAVITGTLRRLCEEEGIPYLRVRRELSYPNPHLAGGGAEATSSHEEHGDRIHLVADAAEAAAYLEGTEGTILLTTGSKELAAFGGSAALRERCLPRVLPTASVLERCEALGFTARQIIAMQGPFSEETNLALLKERKVAWLVTKDSGEEGGCPEKLSAAQKLGVRVVLIGRPEEETEALPLPEVIRQLEELSFGQGASGCGISSAAAADKEQPAMAKAVADKEQPKTSAAVADEDQPETATEPVGCEISRDETSERQNVQVHAEADGAEQERVATLIGLGPGDPAYLTEAARQTILAADAWIGSKRMLDAAAALLEGTDRPVPPSFRSIAARDTAELLLTHPEIRRAAILYSGDISLCSGAKQMRERMPDGIETRVLPGISSISLFLARCGCALEETRIVTLHGKERPLLPLIRRHRQLVCLVGKRTTLKETAGELHAFGMDDIRITLGEQLSYKEERFLTGSPETFLDMETETVSLLLFENPNPERIQAGFGLPDEAFIRGKVPMTKREVRALSLSALDLRSDSVVWDIGAGTGSVSIEAALHCPDGAVYAIERNPEAIALLQENRRKFRCSQLTIVEGEAPQVLTERPLPAPDAVFIGGSGGHLRELLTELFRLNPRAVAVVNAITDETAAELNGLTAGSAVGCEESLSVETTEILAIRHTPAGRYHLRRAENPVLIARITCASSQGHVQRHHEGEAHGEQHHADVGVLPL